MVKILIALVLFLTQNTLSSYGAHSFKKIQLPSLGSEAYAFDAQNGGPYTGLNDGRIVKFHGPNLGFLDFATTTQNRSKRACDGTSGNDLRTCLVCGKPIGLEFNKRTGDLYILDAYHGLMVVGKGGGAATQLAGGRGGTHFDFADGIDLDPITGVVYITDLGSILSKTSNMTEILLGNDRSGRLLKYDPKTKQCGVILTGLAMPAGVAVARDGSFVLMTEYLNCRITRYWLKGPKANTSDIFAELPGNPDNIKRTKTGDFWVAVNIQKLHPKLTVFPLGQKISAKGEILETVNFYGEYNATYITEVQEQFGKFYVASIYTDFVGVYSGGLRC
ncbi:hypothetical protein RD792_015295 [Penstemon davidsonii]|uniref:Strictosidine synthase conserved region domain-containing protein n=1 Tax=Penstemon davidsonii TaxID=160366 RepID=A0ABR0CRN6_9LAMI|nr:hypothetical protein RD792_015295 [Penstemon davidsonii]